MAAAPTSTQAPPPRSAPPPPRRRERLRDRAQHFWGRVTEGLELDQLWSEFKSEARTSYRLYARDVDAKGIDHSQKHSWWEVCKEFFWAFLMKLSPARRVLLLIALVLLLTPAARMQSGNFSLNTTGTSTWGGLLLLVLLLLETSDRVTMKRDLQIAREIQSWLVPETPPQIAGLDVAFVTRPANTVAGDYYDVFRKPGSADNGRVLLTVADVAGKSIPAALLMASFQASLQTLSTTPCTLAELVTGLNRFSCAHSSGGRRFTTAFLAELDPVTGDLTYTNAGHNLPFLRRTSGGIERLDVGGLPLGVLPDAPYQCGSAALRTGDMLLIFTDGLVEAVNEGGAEYEESPVLRVLERCGNLPAAEILRELMLDVNLFVGTASQHDDITCLVVRKT